MNRITLAQREALDVIKDMIDRSNTAVPEYGTKIMTLIFGILNVDCRAEYTVTDITDIEGDKTIPINPNNGNDKIHINIPDWLKDVPTPPFNPNPYPPQVWYNYETDPIQTNAQEHRRYVTEVSCTDDKNAIVSVSCTNDNNCIGDTITTAEVFRQNTGDFRDEQEQSTFKDK